MTEVLLLEDVQKLGHSGEVVKVSDGYARNFLFPRKFGVVATKGVVEMARVLAQGRESEKRKTLEDFQALKQQLEALECQIPVKAGKEDHLFGAVTTTHVARALAKAGISVDRRKIVLSEPIKALGNFTVVVKLYPEVEATLKISVVKQ